MAMEFEPLSLWDLTEKTLKPFLVQARESSICFKLYIESQDDKLSDFSKEGLSAMCVIVVPVKLAQVLRNLFSNALKFRLLNSVITKLTYRKNV